jgi:hypothetical protein
LGQRTVIECDLPAETDVAASYQQLYDALILSRTTALFFGFPWSLRVTRSQSRAIHALSIDDRVEATLDEFGHLPFDSNIIQRDLWEGSADR